MTDRTKNRIAVILAAITIAIIWQVVEVGLVNGEARQAERSGR